MAETQIIRVMIVDANRLPREALEETLNRCPNIQVVAAVGTDEDVVALAQANLPDVIVLDPRIANRDGLDLTRELSAIREKKTGVLVLSTERGPHHAYRMLRAGAGAWLPKTVGRDEIAAAIEAVTNGHVYLPPQLKQAFAESYIQTGDTRPPEESLSEREYQVTRFLAMGKTNREISKILSIGTKTIDTHRANILKKLSLRNNADLTRFAIRNGLVSL